MTIRAACILGIDPGLTGATAAEQLREVLSYDKQTGEFRWLRQRGNARAGATAGYRRADGRFVIRVYDRLYLRSRLAFLYMTGAWPETEVDHIDCDGGNDAWNNLRAATRSQNEYNKGPRYNNKSGLKGVQWSAYHKKWRARINRKFLGFYSTPAEASAAYWRAAIDLAGDFARAG